MKSDMQLRQEISNARKLLRERRKQRLGTATKRGTEWRGEHEYLYGERAHLLRRMEIFRNAGGEVVLFEDSSSYSVEEIKPAMCQGCTEPHEVGWEADSGQWHHNCTQRKKCDAIACALYVCPGFHVRFHNRIIATRQIGEKP